MTQVSSVENIEIKFIEEWLNHFAILNVKDKKAGSIVIDYYLLEQDIAIIYSKWKKPISIQLLNKIIKTIEELSLNEVFLITNEISNFSCETIEKLDLPIHTLHPTNLSELAMQLVSWSKLRTHDSSLAQPNNA